MCNILAWLHEGFGEFPLRTYPLLPGRKLGVELHGPADRGQCHFRDLGSGEALQTWPAVTCCHHEPMKHMYKHVLRQITLTLIYAETWMHWTSFECVWILFSLESHFKSRAEGPTAKGTPPNTGVESLSNLRVIRIVRITRLVRLTRIARITRCLAPGRLWGSLLPFFCPQLPPNKAIKYAACRVQVGQTAVLSFLEKKSDEGSEQLLRILRGA